MSRYALYTARQLLGPILLITLMLGGMGWIIQAVRLLELLGGQTKFNFNLFWSYPAYAAAYFGHYSAYFFILWHALWPEQNDPR